MTHYPCRSWEKRRYIPHCIRNCNGNLWGILPHIVWFNRLNHPQLSEFSLSAPVTSLHWAFSNQFRIGKDSQCNNEILDLLSNCNTTTTTTPLQIRHLWFFCYRKISILHLACYYFCCIIAMVACGGLAKVEAPQRGTLVHSVVSVILYYWC